MYTIRNTDGNEFGPADLDTITQWTREGRVGRDALLIPQDGSDAISVFAIPELATIFNAPPLIPGQTPDDDAPLSGLIPYKNPPALIGYYLGIFSCFPVIGIILGPAAIILGIKGLRQRKRDPKKKGSAHAWIAIITGIIGTLIGLFFLIVILLSIFANP